MNTYFKKEFKKIYHEVTAKNFKFSLSTDEEVKDPYDIRYSNLEIKPEKSATSSMNLSREAIQALYELVDHSRDKIKLEDHIPLVKLREQEWNL